MKASQINVHYISPSRTIESYKSPEGLFYIYNFEGYHFRFFKDVKSLKDFFKNGKEPKESFDSEEELDKYLLNY